MPKQKKKSNLSPKDAADAVWSSVLFNSAKDAPLNVRIGLRESAALVLEARKLYRTRSSLVQEWVNDFLKYRAVVMPTEEQAFAIMQKAKRSKA